MDLLQGLHREIECGDLVPRKFILIEKQLDFSPEMQNLAVLAPSTGWAAAHSVYFDQYSGIKRTLA